MDHRPDIAGRRAALKIYRARPNSGELGEDGAWKSVHPAQAVCPVSWLVRFFWARSPQAETLGHRPRDKANQRGREAKPTERRPHLIVKGQIALPEMLKSTISLEKSQARLPVNRYDRPLRGDASDGPGGDKRRRARTPSAGSSCGPCRLR
jgi:hypothetical protein